MTSSTTETLGETPATVEEQFALVEIMGHDRVIGRVFEVSQFGAAMCRVETLPLPAETECHEGEGSKWITDDYGQARYVSGYYLRPAIPETLSQIRDLSASAIFSIRYLTREEAFTLSMKERRYPQARFIPSEAPLALPAMEKEPGDGEATGGDETVVNAVFTSSENDENDPERPW